MNRRASLALLMGKQKKSVSKSATATAMVTNTFDPYTGVWGFEQAAHLLRRTTFGPTYAQIKQATSDGLDATISLLFESQPLPADPIYYNFENDPNIANGESWVDEPTNFFILGLNGARKRSLQGWSFKAIRESGMNIREKMVLFWHNHFVVADTNDSRFQYSYMNLLRENALGNFKEFVELITIDPSMLQYLNGTQNSKNAPNENYARELLELFTIGKGDAAEPGDYTNYTEDDVVQIARALTGWRHFDIDNLTEVQAGFNPNRHDTEDKQLSHRFNDVIISDTGADEYKTVIDIIFQQDEVARFISRKLYRWFVHFDVNSDVEANIIEPMAQMLIADNYDVQPTLMALLSSEHFYDMSVRGCMVTHPIDYLFKMVNTFELELNPDILQEYNILRRLFTAMVPLEMVMYSHPNVAGWKAYYQAPQYYKIWINAVTLPVRMNYSDVLSEGFNVSGFQVKLNVLDFAASLDNPSDPDDLINEIASILFAQPLVQEQIDSLKDSHGITNPEWQDEYLDYVTGNTSLEPAIENKLKGLVKTMLKMPEVYLM
ncbi:MAG: DUF1800 family protein [Saprospiraceae bacterium]